MTKITSQINIFDNLRIINKLITWPNKWKMKFNINKYGIILIRKRNLEFQYLNELMVESNQ